VTPGLPDAAFADAPGFSPTPMELRVMLLAHLRPRSGSLVWDVGGGTGALALEIARLMPHGAVHTLERDPEAIALLEQNRRRFGISNLHIHAGAAPDGLALLPPRPDRVLLEVGRPLGDVLQAVWQALQPGGRLVISTASLEGLVDATDTLGQLAAIDLQVVQATVHRMQRRGSQAKLAAAEPLFLIAAERP
jgi:precorrin-6Y C5,15-methyltransferase (decarboxylating)/cobalt-precorrin-6B (C15)-methyltransferase